MNCIAPSNHLDFRIVYPNDREDLLKLIENNARLCGVMLDWDRYNLELCEDISKMNEYVPLYALRTLLNAGRQPHQYAHAGSLLRICAGRSGRYCQQNQGYYGVLSTPFCRR
ncbi:Orn/Lys/Arg decarboxylase N-terminal domain-containing protein [Shigella flexneri]